MLGYYKIREKCQKVSSLLTYYPFSHVNYVLNPPVLILDPYTLMGSQVSHQIDPLLPAKGRIALHPITP